MFFNTKELLAGHTGMFPRPRSNSKTLYTGEPAVGSSVRAVTKRQYSTLFPPATIP